MNPDSTAITLTTTPATSSAITTTTPNGNLKNEPKISRPIAPSVTLDLKNDSEKKNITANIQEVELLGSVTTFSNGTESGHAVRTSARVIHKMRMDSIRPPTPPPSEKKEPTKEERPTPKTPNQPKAQRNTWTNAERKIFFEALYEYGKDFDAIANFINTKIKRRNPSDCETKTVKDIRFLYYQLLQKATKYLKFSDDVKKVAQELYALINYGEMRKKLLFLNEKHFLKLRDLVYKGTVTIREKGKNIKLRTPSCRALRKLNQLEEWQEDIKLPARIDVILTPSNTDSWGRVQSLAQNPRIRTNVPLQKSVKGLLQTLQHKWRHQEVRLFEKVMTLKHNASNSTNKSRNKNHTENIETPVLSASANKQLCFLPPPHATIHRPMIHLTEFLRSNRICLNSYEERIGATTKGETLCTEKLHNLKEMMIKKRQRHDSGEKILNENILKRSPEPKKIKPEEEIVVSNPTNTNTNFLNPFKSPNTNSNCSTDSMEMFHNEGSNHTLKRETDSEAEINKNENSNDFNSFKLLKDDAGTPDICIIDQHADDAVDNCELRTIASITDEILKLNKINSNSNCDNILTDDITSMKSNGICNNISKKKDKQSDCPGPSNSKRKESHGTNYHPLISDEVIQKIREGWNITNCSDLTFGDLYIMFGEELKVNLEYCWVDIEKENEDAEPQPSTSTADGPSNKLTNIKQSENISNRLKQLLLVAHMNDKQKRRPCCSCGHICDKKLKKCERISTPEEFVFKKPISVTQTSASTMDGHSNDLQPISNYTHSRWYRMRNNIRPVYPSKQIVVRRLLPEQPETTANERDCEIISSCNGAPPNASNEAPEKEVENKVINTPDESLSKILEDKIRNLNETDSETSNGFAGHISESSLKSLLDLKIPNSFQDNSIDAEFFYSNISQMSPMCLLRESTCDSKFSDNGDLNDISLSSFLGQLDSVYEKQSTPTHNTHDMDSNMSIANDATTDYISKFEDLAAEMRAQENLS